LVDISPGTYTLEAKHEHILFKPIEALKISTWLDHLPKLEISYLHICGRINFNIDDSNESEKLDYSY
jgi:hypothetical protein